MPTSQDFEEISMTRHRRNGLRSQLSSRSTNNEGGRDSTIPPRVYTKRALPRGAWNFMIPYMVGMLASNITHFTRGLIKYVPGKRLFRAVPLNSETNLGYLPFPHSLNDSHAGQRNCHPRAK